jgi:hypothetical protein
MDSNNVNDTKDKPIDTNTARIDPVEQLSEVYEAIKKHWQTRGSTKHAKDNILEQLLIIRGNVEQTSRTASRTHSEITQQQQHQAISSLQQDIAEIKAEIKAALKKTWAQTAASISPINNTCSKEVNNSLITQLRKQQEQESLRQQQVNSEIILSIDKLSDDVKAELHTASYETITARLQAVIESQSSQPILLQGIKKDKKGNIKLRELNWNEAYKGLEVRKPNYGIVIHRVPKSDINFDSQQCDIIEQLEDDNPDTDITKVKPLLRKSRDSTTHSIVVYTPDITVANHWLTHGFFIKHCNYTARRYTPHLQITQCYNCHQYGHRAGECKENSLCGKCGQMKHQTGECSNREQRCIQCNGSHEAWHHDCPKRIAEVQRLKALRKQTLSTFTTGFAKESIWT